MIQVLLLLFLLLLSNHTHTPAEPSSTFLLSVCVSSFVSCVAASVFYSLSFMAVCFSFSLFSALLFLIKQTNRLNLLHVVPSHLNYNCGECGEENCVVYVVYVSCFSQRKRKRRRNEIEIEINSSFSCIYILCRFLSSYSIHLFGLHVRVFVLCF